MKVAEVAAAPAVALFEDRARAAASAFRLTDANAGTVAEIVRRLDGLPLAIELAAAQARVLTPDGLLERVASSFDALRATAGDVPERQRALRATLDWSHDLLTDAERALFARLSVFSGGWTMDAATAVCSLHGDTDIVDTLAALLDKSLVAVDLDDMTTEPRFRMLATVQAYACERLVARERDARCSSVRTSSGTGPWPSGHSRGCVGRDRPTGSAG